MRHRQGQGKVASIGALILGAVMALAQAPAAAQSYPNRPVRMIVPFGAGGGTDTISRLVSKKMEESLGQSIVVENKPGANTIIGADAVAKSAPDGYTLLLSLDLTMTMNPALYSKLPYDIDKDFTAVGRVARSQVIYVTNAKQPFQDITQFIAYAKANPNKVTYGAGAISSQVVGEQFARATGIDMVYSNYKSGAEAMLAMLQGDIQLAIMDIPTVLPNIKEGKLRALAVSGEERVPLLPQTPTIGEAGLPDLKYRSWWGIFAPAGTPKPVVDKLNASLKTALESEDLRARMTALTFTPAYSTPAELAAEQREDVAKYRTIIKAAGLSLD